MDCNYSPWATLRFSKRASLRCGWDESSWSTISMSNCTQTNFGSIERSDSVIAVQNNKGGHGHGPYFFLKIMWVCVMWDRQTFWPQCIACSLKKIYFEKTKKSQLKAGRTAIIINILKFLTFLLSSQAQKRHLVLAFVFILCPQIIKDLLFSKICHQLWVQPLTRPPMVVFSLKKIRPLYWLWTSFWFPQDI